MSGFIQPGSFPLRLSQRARLVVAAQPDRHVHALRQLRRYLPDRHIEVVTTGDLVMALPTLGAERIDLLVLGVAAEPASPEVGYAASIKSGVVVFWNPRYLHASPPWCRNVDET